MIKLISSEKAKGNYSLIGCTVAPPFDYGDLELAPKEWEPFLLKLMGIESISKKFLMYKLLKNFKTYKSLKVNSGNKDKEINLKKLIEIINDWKVSNYIEIYPYS